MTPIVKAPLYAQMALVSIAAIAIVYALSVGQSILIPLIYSVLIAILLDPVVDFLVKLKLNKVVAILLAVLFLLLIIGLFIYFVSLQITLFNENYPKLKEKFNEISVQIIVWISRTFDIKISKINNFISDTQNDIIKNLGGNIGQTLSAINSILIIVFLMPVYLFMILFYKPLLLEFIRKLFKKEHHEAVFEVLFNSKAIIQSYLIGLLFEAVIVATLNSIGLMLLGIDYAIILGITGALLNVIPYIGGIIAIALPMIIALVTKESPSYALFVLAVYLLIQFIDNHFIIPRVVASKVKLNALISIIAVLAGAALWGIPGMFLSIPLTAILKVIFDHIESLKAWGFLLGNNVPTSSKIRFGFFKRKKLK